ncbi:glycoside hydrolase family 16 protein [Piedraia hortae CBS 480.64]|uniref:chitinase n=1 Tax=Piedraia hortae CBS 480.64 TaxID=1314780 RepID=A0A6A7BW75_9PEZI|nr:glycoside hydrolase family 16 protein [Piedraia hortae CBS 480.64]
MLSKSTSIVTLLALFVSPSLQQTSTTCDPIRGACPADPALGRSMKADFTTGQSNDFTGMGNGLSFDSNGAVLKIAQSGDSPTLQSKWYIMFGSFTARVKAAPGQGIVSSVVLQSDDLDEIDWEWVGSQNNQVQSNYFGKGQTTTYDRGAAHAVTNPTGEWHTYTVIWTKDQITWQIDGQTVRILTPANAKGQYPQTPMRLKIGAWSGGDPSNAAGTIEWAGGATDYSKGPYLMYVSSVEVTDFSTGTQYSYGDQSGTWTSITAAGGAVNGNANAASQHGDLTAVAAPAITSTTAGGPVAGTGPCVWAARCNDGGQQQAALPLYSGAERNRLGLVIGGLAGALVAVWMM